MSSYSSSGLQLTLHSIPTCSDLSSRRLATVVSLLKAVQVNRGLSKLGYNDMTNILQKVTTMSTTHGWLPTDATFPTPPMLSQKLPPIWAFYSCSLPSEVSMKLKSASELVNGEKALSCQMTPLK